MQMLYAAGLMPARVPRWQCHKAGWLELRCPVLCNSFLLSCPELERWLPASACSVV